MREIICLLIRDGARIDFLDSFKSNDGHFAVFIPAVIDFRHTVCGPVTTIF
ncbi:hypothetical protein SH139x_002041 [Planctomycetaceae bacterium SH139]